MNAEEMRKIETASDIPFGPLEPELYQRLGTADYDGSRIGDQQIARERGIVTGEYARHLFALKAAARTTEPLDRSPQPPEIPQA